MRSRLRIPASGSTGLASVATALALSLLTLPQAVEGQPRPTRPDLPRHYAITGARVVTGAGQTITDGTVVMNDGIITAVGRNVTVPAGAWVIDGAGKTVYPGFIDAMTDLGHPSARPPRGGGGGSPFGPQGPIDESTYSWGPEDRPGTHTWVSAAENINEGDPRFAQWRNAGFTTVVSMLNDGLVTGQAAVLNLGSYERARGMVVATPVAMRLKLQDRSYQGYPQSLMGSFAYLKQLYLDAQHYDRVWDDYEAGAKGKPRPEWDEALEPLRWQLMEQYPVLLPANDRKEIERAISTAHVMGVPPLVYGAQGAYAAADLLAAAGVPALVSLNWPTAPRDGDPEARPALRTLRLWDRAPTTPAELQKAGVAFAFTSGGLSDATEILANARKAVAQGLSREAAVQAFTMAPARIMGVEDRLGSLEVGKIANVVVASGDLFDPGTKVETVFVDGDKFEVPQDEAPARRRRTQPGEDAAHTPVAMAQDQGPFRSDAVTLIRNATIMTASHGTIVGGDILVRDGKIAQVGTGIQAPQGAHVVDGTGKYVTPGIIDAHSHIAADAINEGAVNVSSMVGIKDVLEPNDPNVYWALAGGVTAINILHGSANPIGGGNAVVKLKWGGDAQDMIIGDAQEGIKFALGENTKRDRNPPRYPATRMGVQDVVRQAFLDAQAYQRGWDAWEASGHVGVEPRRDLKLESLAQILRGDRWVHSHSYRADEILQLIRLADEFNFTVRTFQHVLEGYKVADEMAAHGAGASTFSDWWAYKVEAYDAIPYNAALMEERGVLVTINSDSGEEMRHLNQEAAKAMKWGGVAEENALRMITLNAAKQLGIDGRTGSIDMGKDADLTIFDGPPLSMFAKVLQTYVEGALYFDRDLDRERQAAVAREKAALMERYGSDQGDERVASDPVAPSHREEEVR
ncbi:MAG TPA: amidohydrolase family protein [Longimicrobiales bacterium]|nr:amidohydrolase family protein [Longimicrobiales bacterium]